MDSRFHLNAVFRIYGEEFKWDCSLNWTADNPDEIDHRITAWFLDCHNRAYEKFCEERDRLDADYLKGLERLRELEQLRRLKEKYPEA